MKPFRWNGQREQAAVLVAEDRLTNEEIAASLGVTRQAVDYWKRHPDFQGRVAGIVEAERKAVLAKGIADKRNRVKFLDDRHRRLQRVIEARATDSTMATVAGGDTGLMVRTYKSIGTGPTATMVEEYAVDTGMLREMREHEKQAAIELGEWTEKVEHGSDPEKPFVFTIAIDRRKKEENQQSE